MPTRYVLCTGLVAMILAVMTGCTEAVDPPATPTELSEVINNSGTFDDSDEGGLDGIEPGTAVDELATSIDGCWGSYSQQPAEYSDGSATTVNLYQVSKFDTAAGTWTFQLYETDADGSALLLAEWETDLTVVDETSLQSDDVNSGWAYTYDDGVLETIEATTTDPSTVLASISGDKMKMANAPTDDEPDPTTMLFTRLECAD